MWFRTWFVTSCGLLLNPVLCSSGHVSTRVPPSSAADNVFRPSGVNVGLELSVDTGCVIPFTLNSSQPIATLDYGTERAGRPYFSVLDVIGPVQVEVKYSEAFFSLAHPWSDGPYSFSTGLSNSFRVETFNITRSGRFVSPLIQGGQRWLSIRLLTEGAVAFDDVGFEATVDTTEVDDFPGQFDSDDEQFNAIWKLGGQAAATACVEEGTQPPIWSIDPTNGAYITSLRPAQAISGAFFANYTLHFDTMIERGGVWWAVAFPLVYSPGGIHLQLVSELPEESTFVNVNKSLTPPNSIVLSYGYDFVNQTTLPSYLLDTFSLPMTISEGTWYSITTVLSPNGRLAVLVNNETVLDILVSDYWTPTPLRFFSSFGFGAYQDQAAYVRNVLVTDTANGTVLYENPMTDLSVLAEHGTQTNLGSVCLDGPKRDRLVWLGDFYHTARIIGTSTSRHDLIRGTLDFLLKTQIADGQLAISPLMGFDPTITPPFVPADSYHLSDYQMLGIDSVHTYIRQTNDLAWLRSTWTEWQAQGDWVISKLNKTDGLFYATSVFLGAGTGGSALSCLAVQALRELSELATALNDTEAQSRYTSAADDLSDAINDRLWNDDLGVFSLSQSAPNGSSVAGTAFCITSGVSSSNQTARSLVALPALALAPGYKDFSAMNASDPSVKISPNTNGFLLDALFKSGAWDTGAELIRSLWGAMIKDPRTASGASWEYVALNGEPGLSRFTSLAHPWGGAATYVLTEWAAGIRAADGVEGFGYENWVVSPDAGLAMGLKWAKATVVTPRGVLAVDWQLTDQNELLVNIDAPNATQGVLVLGETVKTLRGQDHYSVTTSLGG